MGAIVNAECLCGFKKELLIGGGMLNFMTRCDFPCYCEKCLKIFKVNLFSNSLQCPVCKTDMLRYDNRKLHPLQREKTAKGTLLERYEKKFPPKPDIIFEWNFKDENLKLYDDNYLCPKCHKVSLKFIDSGSFD